MKNLVIMVMLNFFLKDKEYEKFLEDIRKILKNKEEFCKIQEEYIKRLEGNI